MFLHLQVPGFHAVVHQVRTPALRGRPVAVAVDAGLQSPLFATSPEARLCHVAVGMRTDEALRRCPRLQVVTPDPEAYRAAQRALAQVCASVTARVGGSAGRIDLDLACTEELWRQRAGVARDDDPLAAARAVALLLRRRCTAELGFEVFVGGGGRLLIARLAAALAREPHLAQQGVMILGGADEAAATDLMPIALLADCDAHIRDLLGRCGIATIGQLRALPADELLGLVGPGGARLYDVLHGLREEMVPEVTDSEPSLSAACRGGPGGVGPDGVQGMLMVLARELAFQLRQRHLGCTRLTLDIGWCDARTSNAAVELRYQTVADHALAAAAGGLFAQHARTGTRVDRLRLTASGLCTAELQQEWFPAMRPAAAESGPGYDAAGTVTPSSRSGRASAVRKRQRR